MQDINNIRHRTASGRLTYNRASHRAGLGGRVTRSRTMLGIALPRQRPERGPAGFGARIGRLVDAIELAIEVRRERRMLLGLDDHTLKDLGLARGDAYAEAARVCWDIPSESSAPTTADRSR